MYSEKLKEEVLKLCFEEKASSFTKETKGFDALKSAFPAQKGILDSNRKVFICKQGAKVEINYSYSGKIEKEEVRFHVLRKTELPYIFKVNFDNEELELVCDQYEIQQN